MNPVELFEQEFSDYIGSRYAVAVCNGTAALHSALLALGVGEGDKVVTTAYTFPATSNAVLMCGGEPVFADIAEGCWNVDPESIEHHVAGDPDIIGILPVHLFGKPCQMRQIMKIAEDYGIWVLEDSSQAIGQKLRGSYLGTFGDAGTYSFYASKNLPAYEGGMVVTDRADLAVYLRRYRNHGLDEDGRMVCMGYNYKLPWNNAFHGWQYLKLHKLAITCELGKYGLGDGYYSRVVYQHPYYRQLGYTGDCPNAEALAEKVRSGMFEDI